MPRLAVPTNVVYLLGAGFSAPLGLPVMGNFLLASKDLFAGNAQKYAHFKDVYSLIDRMHSAKTVYNADLLNIEEILSIAEMSDQLKGNGPRRAVVDLIRDVVEARTPPLKSRTHGWRPSNWHDHPYISEDPTWELYCRFLASIFGVRAARAHDRIVLSGAFHGVRYDFVSLNYDRVLELATEAVCGAWEGPTTIGLLRADSPALKPQDTKPLLCKLHGGIDGPEIIPPTWSKRIVPQIQIQWSTAHSLLVEAQELRILGYSLPQADAYVRYLLKSAAMDSFRLKRIDVVCRDADGRTKRRYDDLVGFNFYRYRSADLVDYLKAIGQAKPTAIPGSQEAAINLTGLESAHETFMESA